jgi:molybdate transport system substrate-binding protein
MGRMSKPTSRPRFAALIMLIALAAAQPACRSGDDPVLVLAAASTIDAMEAAVTDYRAGNGTAIEVSFASSALLARQIEQGAPADLLLSASVEWADYVAQRVGVARREVLVGNRLAVVVPVESSASPTSLEQIAQDARLARIAIADPQSVPAGIYAAEALRRSGLWEALQPRLIPAVDARAALALVATGEADAGLVYASDAASTAAVRAVTRIDPRLHAAIDYPRLLLDGAGPQATRFFEYLVSARGRAHFHDRGFIDAGG